jgi:hypothetical protein
LTKRKENSKLACQLIKEKTIENQKQNDKYFKHEVSEKVFRVGEHALLYTPKSSKKGIVDKLAYSYRPVIIDKVLDNNAYELVDAETKHKLLYKFHADRLVSDKQQTTELQDRTAAANDPNKNSDELVQNNFRDRKLRRSKTFSGKKTALCNPSAADSRSNQLSGESSRVTSTDGRSNVEQTSQTMTDSRVGCDVSDCSGEPTRASLDDEGEDKSKTQKQVSSETAVEPKSILKQSKDAQNSEETWFPIRRIVSRRRGPSGWEYKVEWDGDTPSFSFVKAKDLTKGAIDNFMRGLRQYRRRR